MISCCGQAESVPVDPLAQRNQYARNQPLLDNPLAMTRKSRQNGG
jgi:hypothetical protein